MAFNLESVEKEQEYLNFADEQAPDDALFVELGNDSN
jgi:hypothetical protein